MKAINTELLIKFHMRPLAEWKEIVKGDDLEFYYTFLMQSDYVINKIIESDDMAAAKLEHADVLEARAYCRQQINAIEASEASEN